MLKLLLLITGTNVIDLYKLGDYDIQYFVFNYWIRRDKIELYLQCNLNNANGVTMK